CTRLSVGVW
nr:immunoglobulin heavy chain junction region [Macaca mulatta]MOX02655.1 immunoglobulin heavy chain junction region [Macaca mulatta]MOX06271.1 immunoglobulin heavy chain junction region [Macaca mulatta]